MADLDLSLSGAALDIRDRVVGFLETEVYPVEEELTAAMDSVAGPEPFPTLMTELRARARKEGLWNLFLSGPGGSGLTTVEYAHVCEPLGRLEWAPSVFNCNFPDTGNMEILTQHGTPGQRRRWLDPLLEGETRSCFALTEPDIASSDPTGIATTAVRDGADWVVTGRKWYISGAIGAACCVTMVRTGDDDTAPHSRLSVLLIPMDTPGLRVVRRVALFGHAAGPGHCELAFDGCRVGPEALLGEVGDGFRIAQDRLGPGRIHHCMRSIGAAERALELTCRRALHRAHRGGVLADEALVRGYIAESRIDIDAARLLVMRAAHTIDTQGKRAAYRDISVAKVFVPRATSSVIDRAIQVHGALGVSDDVPLARMWAIARALRIGDGVDEVHLATIAKRELAGYGTR